MLRRWVPTRNRERGFSTRLGRLLFPFSAEHGNGALESGLKTRAPYSEPPAFQLLGLGQGIGAEKGRVTHFPHADCAALAVEVEDSVFGLQQRRPVRRLGLTRPEVAEEVEHDTGGNEFRGAKRQAEGDAQLLLEL